MSAASARNTLTTLWRATLRYPAGMVRVPSAHHEEFFFREANNFPYAAQTAQTLLKTSPACKMAGAEIVKVERIAHLWN